MPVDLYQPFVNKIAGETFRCTEFNEEVFTMEWTVQPEGYVPFEHIHYNQDEIFHVKKGEIRLVLEGRELIGKPGDVITVPKGKAHIAYNNKPEVLECVVQYKPCLDHYKFYQCFGGLLTDGYMDKKGMINVPRMGYFMKKMNTKALARPTSIPASTFKLAMNVFYLMGVVSGWKKLYYKYTGDDK